MSGTGGQAAAGCRRPGGVAAAARTGLSDVLGLVAVNQARPARLRVEDHYALRLVCRDVCEANDTSRPDTRIIVADRLPVGRGGAAAGALFPAAWVQPANYLDDRQHHGRILGSGTEVVRHGQRKRRGWGCGGGAGRTSVCWQACGA